MKILILKVIIIVVANNYNNNNSNSKNNISIMAIIILFIIILFVVVDIITFIIINLATNPNSYVVCPTSNTTNNTITSTTIIIIIIIIIIFIIIIIIIIIFISIVIIIIIIIISIVIIILNKSSPLFSSIPSHYLLTISPAKDTMEGSGLDTACLASLQACRSTLGAWPSPPAAHSNNILGNHGNAGNSINSSNFGNSSSIGSSSSNNNNNSISAERLCLAQISNTLLKEYSYNEIHNRRVALGITCVQCTPVQLEILRRAGAMPVSSRRCGMITKREAERLVRSFLEENTPPKLPDDFAFDVHHECGWGCRGFFEPSRYNSSRAKCIKCFYCNVYFSPNKFIFHFHRTSESKYSHPDAANFNSWRRHLKLFSGNENEEITYKWEDVKAMFNGGTRKRPFPSSSSATSSLSSSQSPSSASLPSPGSHHHHQNHHASHTRSHLSPPSTLNTSGRTSLSAAEIPGATQGLAGMYGERFPHLHFDGSGGPTSSKKSKHNVNVPGLDSNPYMQKHPGAPFVNPFSPYWLATTSSGAGKAPYPFMAMNPSQSMCFGFPTGPHPGPSHQQTNSKDFTSDRTKSVHLSPASWIGRASAAAAAAAGGAPPFPLSSMDFFWDKALAFPQAAGLSFRPGTYPSALMPSAVGHGSTGGTNVNMGTLNNIPGPGASLMELPEQFNLDGQMHHSPSERRNSYNRVPYREIERGEKVKDHMSAFKRVRPSSSSPSSTGSPPPHSGFEDQEDAERDCPEDTNTQTERRNDSNNNYSSNGNSHNNSNNTNSHRSPSQNNDDKQVGDHVGGDRDEDGDGSMCAEDLSTQRELEESEDIDVEEEGASADGTSTQRSEIGEGGEESTKIGWAQERHTTHSVKETVAEEREINQRPKTQDPGKQESHSPEDEKDNDNDDDCDDDDVDDDDDDDGDNDMFSLVLIVLNAQTS
ncbi:SKI family transcriptional corepressor 1 [Elysia marginata]|uniref:SKI family transcriptional corepressor 1 n=1 Tax=Elysia marginata TaxID=1093978 RepID=A0AAV4HL45_9GAST|nr:SKI family transcriptional corepressor 1 [Elysia marginata]